MAGLVVIEGPNRGAIHTLLPDRNRIGRDPASEVVVLDERASRFHAEVSLEGDLARLRDLDSSNGTYLNGIRCDEATLEAGDELRIGEVTLLFVDALEGAGPALPAGHSTLCLDLPRDGEGPPVRVAAPERPPALLGKSNPIIEVQRMIFRAASMESTVLVTGESGTGKELVARALHRNSPRRAGPFLALNGAVLRGELLESELFGHEKGSFTGAIARRQGAFELAAGGTLFLDEVGELPAQTQSALLRVLEGQGFRRLGGREPITPNVRLVAATNKDLAAAVTDGSFRRDLFHRLEVVRIHLPPLRERPGDVAVLAEQFLKRARKRTGTPARRFEESALAALEAYPFPGNVRELLNLVERVAIFSDEEVIGLDMLPAEVRAAARPDPDVLDACAQDDLRPLREVEREHIARVLDKTGWNKSRAARILGIDRVTLYKRIARYGLEP